MKVRQKTVIIIVLASLIMISSLYIISQTILLRSFADIEEQRMKLNVDRVNSALSAEFSELDSKCGDWAEWDDTYTYMQNLNHAYERANLVDASFINLRVNFILFINSTGQLISGMAFDLKNMTAMPIPQSVKQLILTEGTVWLHETINSSVTGIALLPENPIILASRPILTSQREGPIQGTLIFARYFDDAEVQLLAETVHLPLVMHELGNSQLPADFKEANSVLSVNAPILANPLNSDSFGGYSLLSDFMGQPILIMRAEMPRDIYKQGQATVGYLVVSMLVACAVFSALIMLLLEKVILQRLDQLTGNVVSIGKRDNLSERLTSSSGNDELSILTKSINGMLTEIESKTVKLQKTERLATIGELATMVAHDLRNPLQGIANAAFYLKKNAIQKEGKQQLMLQLIEEDVKYSDKIINDLLDYSRGMQLHLEETNPKALVDVALSAVEIPANVIVSNETEDKPKLQADVLCMKRAFVNIARNALEAMPKGGTLKVSSRKVNRDVEFTFSDSGTGISKEDLGKIFTPLFTTKPKGMGFGLAICKRVVEAHGGKICVVSIVGKGATFTLTVPVEPKIKGGENDWVYSPKSLLLTTTKA